MAKAMMGANCDAALADYAGDIHSLQQEMLMEKYRRSVVILLELLFECFYVTPFLFIE